MNCFRYFRNNVGASSTELTCNMFPRERQRIFYLNMCLQKAFFLFTTLNTFIHKRHCTFVPIELAATPAALHNRILEAGCEEVRLPVLSFALCKSYFMHLRITPRASIACRGGHLKFVLIGATSDFSLSNGESLSVCAQL